MHSICRSGKRRGCRSMSKIFISYRRKTSAAAARLIYERLYARFGADAIFMDIDAISIGVDFRKHIRGALERCNIVLALIGRNWAGKPGGRRSIHDPRDFVRIEIEVCTRARHPGRPDPDRRRDDAGRGRLAVARWPLAYRNAIEVDLGRSFRPARRPTDSRH